MGSPIIRLATAAMVVILATIMPACTTTAHNILYSGETLQAGESLKYAGVLAFTMQTDCNLVLSYAGKPIWQTNTAGGVSTRCRLIMQKDGNLVIYDQRDLAIWASHTYAGGSRNYVCVLQRDRNVVVYGAARWATNTSKGGAGLAITVNVGNSNETTACSQGAVMVS